MYCESEYVALKALKHRSPVEESRWQNVREERRRVLNIEAKRSKRTGYSEEQKIKEQRAKLTEEEAAAATKKNTDRRRLARARAKEGDANKMLIVEVSENGEVISKRSVPVGDNKNVAPLPELGLLAVVQPAEPEQEPCGDPAGRHHRL